MPDDDPTVTTTGRTRGRLDPGRVREVLAEAVEALGGQERAGQVQMSEAVAHAFEDGRHLLVQAGTGTGKSLAYLVPAMLHHKRVVVATATLALQQRGKRQHLVGFGENDAGPFSFSFGR